MSTDAEVDMAIRERKREEWEVDNYIEGESKIQSFIYILILSVQEMVEFYMAKGVSEENARQVVQILAKYKHAFVDIMVSIHFSH